MNKKDLCIALVRCETEREVISLLKEAELWDAPTSWRLFGDDENNFSIIGSQQSKPESAIVEKLINSVDAVLMRECLKRNIEPASSDAPQSIVDALVHFFKIDNGRLSNITVKERNKLAENICLVASGKKTHPTFAIIDKGEGQSPARLPDTILSLRKSNKLRIPFVQGKFNMGGTGVLRFCGEFNLQLVVSKRNLDVASFDRDATSSCWGFTVIRRENPDSGVRNSNYKYLAPEGDVLSFSEDELPLLPGEYPDPYGKPLKSGTYIKLYEYKIGSLKTNILFDLYNKLSLLMPEVALPVRLFERRKGYKGHSLETTLSGLSVRIDEDKLDNIEDGFPTSGSMIVKGQKIKYSIYVFRKNKHEKYKKDEGVIFSVNGQSHGYISRSIYNRNRVGLGYLAESILVILDCSEIDGRSREDLFMNSRDRLSSCELRSEIERSLEEILRNHQGLRSLKERRRRDEIESKLHDAKPLIDVLHGVLKKSPALSRLFLQGQKLPNPFKTTSVEPVDGFNGVNSILKCPDRWV